MAFQPQVCRAWLDLALMDLEKSQLGRRLLPLHVPGSASVSARLAASSMPTKEGENGEDKDSNTVEEVQIFDGLGPWDREAVEVEVSAADLQNWLGGSPCTGLHSGTVSEHEASLSNLNPLPFHKLLSFSSNDYLALSVHPSVRRAAAKAALECGMGPRSAALHTGYTHHHRKLESALAELNKTEDCLLCPTGFAASMAVMTALSGVVAGGLAEREGPFAIFSDALNHASIIDGIHLAQRSGRAEAYPYRHSDMSHLEQLLLRCKLARKVVVTNSLFSMDGDVAKLAELAALRRKYNFLLFVDDAHGTLLYGENGGGAPEALGVEGDNDICMGTLSKAAGCLGGFIATSRKSKQWILSRGRSFIFTTALPVPVVAAAHAAIIVAQKERWRRLAVWERVEQVSRGLGVQFCSPLIPIIIGDADETIAVSMELLKAGFHVFPFRPPVVKEGTARLRITISAAHTEADIQALLAVLPLRIKEKAKSRGVLSTPYLNWKPTGLHKTCSREEQAGLVHGALESHMIEQHMNNIVGQTLHSFGRP